MRPDHTAREQSDLGSLCLQIGCPGKSAENANDICCE